MKLPRNAIFALLIILEAAVCVLFYMYYYVPKNAELAQLEAEVYKKRQHKREIELTKKQLAKLQIENKLLEEQIMHLEKFLPEEYFVPTVLLQIEQLATATRLTVSKMTPKSKAASQAQQKTGQPTPATAPGAPAPTPEKVFDPAKEYKTNVVDLDISGTFDAVKNFLEELASFPKLVVIEEIRISNQTQAAANDKGDGDKSEEEDADSAGELKIAVPLTFYMQQGHTPAAATGTVPTPAGGAKPAGG